MKLVLASASPRRKELLGMFFQEFTVCPAKGEEAACPGLGAAKTVKALSAAKAKEVAAAFSAEHLILAADTLVYLGEEKLGKPADEADAARMLRALSGNMHSVFTGVTLQQGKTVLSCAEETRVFFRPITEREIAAYLRSGEPMDKAGAYGIQGLASAFIERIEGDYFNVMGLPLCLLGKMLREFGTELL